MGLSQGDALIGAEVSLDPALETPPLRWVCSHCWVGGCHLNHLVGRLWAPLELTGQSPSGITCPGGEDPEGQVMVPPGTLSGAPSLNHEELSSRAQPQATDSAFLSSLAFNAP